MSGERRCEDREENVWFVKVTDHGISIRPKGGRADSVKFRSFSQIYSDQVLTEARAIAGSRKPKRNVSRGLLKLERNARI